MDGVAEACGLDARVLKAIVGVGLFQFHKADFRDELKLGEMSAREDTWATRAGRLGYAARGVVLGVIGNFLVQAAVQTEPDRALGLGGAPQTLARQPFGPYILGAVALGLVAYGAFMFVMAWYRKIKPTRACFRAETRRRQQNVLASPARALIVHGAYLRTA